MICLALRNAALCAAFLTSTVAPAQWNFELDTTFRTEIQHRYVNSLLVDTGGMVITSGVMRYPGEFSDKRLVRLYENGLRDETFNNSGLGGGRLRPWQQDKCYVNAGSIVRRILLPSGDIDPTFSMGYMQIPYFLNSTGGDYHVFDDGRVLMSGSHLLSDSIRGFEGYYELIWFTSTGYLDTTRVHRNANGPIYDFKELPDGKFICSCSCTQYEGQPVSRLFRVHADGALDTSFQSDVVLGNIYEFEAMQNGRILVGGNYRRSVVPQDTIRLARFLADGSFDPSFGPLDFDGNPSWWPWFGTQVFDIFPFTVDRYIIAGQFTSVNGQPRSGLCLVDTSGNLLPELEDFYVGPFAYQTTTNAGFTNVYWNQDSTALYVCGTYASCDDGTTNDTLQRFVSRLLVHDIGMAVPEQEVPALRVYPNPAHSTATLELKTQPVHAHVLLRDALGRVTLRQALPDRTTTLELQTLPDGCYTLEVHAADRPVVHQRLIVQH